MGQQRGTQVQAGLTLERMGLWPPRDGGSSQEPGKGTPEPREPGCKKATLAAMGTALVVETTTLGETPASTVSWRQVGAESFVQGTPGAPDPQATMSASRLNVEEAPSPSSHVIRHQNQVAD